MEKVPEKKKRPRGKGGHRNPLKLAALLPFVLPAVVGLLSGLLDGKAPGWWTKIGPKAKAFILVIAAVIARRKKRLELFGALMALAFRELGTTLANHDVKGLEPSDDDVQDAADAEMDELARELQDIGDGDEDGALEEPDVRQALGALAHEDIGAIYDEIRGIEEYADAA